jgi:hypothetical protein
MEEIPLTRAHLESLTTGDLIKMAEAFGLDMPDNPERVLVIEELLETAPREEEFSYEPEMANPVIMDSVSLPRSYNMAFIEVMIRDPLWAFVFWEIKASDLEHFENAYDFNGYYLKVSPLEKSDDPSQTAGVFKVPVKAEDTAWYLGLASEEEGASWSHKCQYKVEFCASLGGIETVMAVSNPVRLPGQPVLSSGGWENQLGHLSGYGDFHVFRRNERPLRMKRSQSACSNE